MSTSKTWPGGATGATPTSYSIPAAGELNWASLSDFLIALADGAQGTTFQKGAIRKAVTSPITVSTVDYCVVSDLTTPGAVAVNLPAGANKQIFYVIDGKGDATTNNITITPDGSETIGGAATLVLSSNNEGVGLIYSESDTDWIIFNRSNQAGSSVGGFTADKVIISDGSGNLSAATTSTTQVQYLASATGTTGTASTNVVFSTSPVLTTPNIGTPSAGVLTNCTGLVLTSGVTGVLPVANGGTNSSTALNSNRMIISSGGAIVEQSAITAARTLVSDGSGLPVASSTTTTQVEYLSAATGTTGTTSTNLVFSTSPVLTTPNIGTPSAGVLTNCTGLVLTSGVTGVLPVANGGTNSSTALNSNRMIISSGGAIVEQSAITASRALVSDGSGLPAASTTSTTQVQYLASATGTTGTTSTNLVFSGTPTLSTPVISDYADVTTSGATNPYLEFTSNTSNVGGYVYYQHSADVMAIRHDSGTDTDFTINSSSQIGIGTNAPRTAYYSTTATQRLTVEQASNTYLASFINNVNTASGAEIILAKSRGTTVGSNTVVQDSDILGRVLFGGTDGTYVQAAAEIRCEVDGTPGATDMPGRLSFRTTPDGSISPSERMAITEDGLVGIGIQPATAQLHVANEDVNDNTTIKIDNDVRSWSLACRGDTSDIFAIIDNTAAAFRLSIDTNGYVLNGKTSSSFTTSGIELRGTGGFWATSEIDSAIHRPSTDGNLLSFWQANSQEGVISVSGTTVTYGSFCGSHWSQLADKSKDLSILRGTVMESINEKCTWEGEENDQLAKCKVSDTDESKAVYGVFFGWDEQSEEQDENNNPNTKVPGGVVKAEAAANVKEDIRAVYRDSNDMFIAAIGAFVVRVRKGESLEIGDYLQSAGDGTAKKQADDIMRSSTIAKVTCTEKVETYQDGSYLVSCTLHCG